MIDQFLAFMIFLLAAAIASAVYWGIVTLVARFLPEKRDTFVRLARICYLILGVGVLFYSVYFPFDRRDIGGGSGKHQGWHIYELYLWTGEEDIRLEYAGDDNGTGKLYLRIHDAEPVVLTGVPESVVDQMCDALSPAHFYRWHLKGKYGERRKPFPEPFP